MRVLKFVVNALVLFVLLPVSIVAVLGIVFSPLQPTARAVEPRTAFEASDIKWDELDEPGAPSLEVGETEPMAGAEPDCESASEAIEVPGESFDAVEGVAAEMVEQLPGTEDGSAVEDDDSEPEEFGGAVESTGYYSSEQLRTQGVIDDGYRYTWYSQRVLPGGGLDIEGRHVSAEGYVVDGQDRIVVASSDLPRGTELAVPFGSGSAIVLDTGCASGTIDVYTDF